MLARLPRREQAQPQGEKGEPGPPATQPLIVGWKIDAKNFRAVPFGADGKPLPELDLRPLAQAILDLAANAARDDMEDMERDLTKMVQRRGW